MDRTLVPSPARPSDVLERIQELRPELSPELRKAGEFILAAPSEVGVTTIRDLAIRAHVKPNTLVRLSRAIGLDGYDALREVFREEIRRRGHDGSGERAAGLQSLSKEGRLSRLYVETAHASIGNLERFFHDADHAAIEQAARTALDARRLYVLGVGVCNAMAQNFAYVAGMAIDGVRALPAGGASAVDGLARADNNDALIAMTFHPYRREVLEAVEVARAQSVPIIAISDSLASPIMARAAHRFVTPTETPQFFTSTVALAAFLETLVSFMIAMAGETAINSIEKYHGRRRDLGIYLADEGST